MFSIDAMSRTPVYEQIINQIEKYVAAGILNAGTALPSVRSLSVELSVNPNTVQKAFNDLFGRGIIDSVPGKGSFISNRAEDIIREKDRGQMNDFKMLARKLLMAGITAGELTDIVKQAEEENKEVCK